jgi:uncharacterized repeat protein (TIGR01451 family)
LPALMRIITPLTSMVLSKPLHRLMPAAMALIGLAAGSGFCPKFFVPCAPPAPPCELPISEPSGLQEKAAEKLTQEEGTPNPEDPPAPVVLIRVRAPAASRGDSQIEYRLTIVNQSTAPAHHVLVRNPLPANVRLVRASPEPSVRGPELLWQLGTLEGDKSRDIILVVAPTGPGDVQNCARVQFEHGECVRTKVKRPRLRVVKSGPSQAILYDAFTYRLTVTNAGDAEATKIHLSDALSPGLELVDPKNPLKWDWQTLEPGKSQSVELHVVAKAAGRLCNRAQVTAEGGLHQEVESCLQVTEPKLTLKMAAPAQRYVNLVIPYQVAVSNPGTAALGNVIVASPVPPKTSLVSAGQGGKLVDREVQWQVGTLAAGETRQLELELRAVSAGTTCNHVRASADRGLAADAEACTELLGVPALLLELVDTEDPIEVGAETKYIVIVRNQGTLPATNVQISALVPPQLEVAGLLGPADGRKNGARVMFLPVTIQPQTDVRYLVTVKALRPGDIRFKVDLTADQLPSGPVHEEESTTIYAENSVSRKTPAKGTSRQRRPGVKP